MEKKVRPAGPADLVVVKDFGRGSRVWTDATGVLGEEAGQALREWQHQTVTQGEGWEDKAAVAAAAFRQIAGFGPEDVRAAEDAKKIELGLKKS